MSNPYIRVEVRHDAKPIELFRLLQALKESPFIEDVTTEVD